MSTNKVEALTQTCNSFYWSPWSIPQEVSYLIKQLKNNKAKKSHIETRSAKCANRVVSVFLSKLINFCEVMALNYPNSAKPAMQNFYCLLVENDGTL